MKEIFSLITKYSGWNSLVEISKTKGFPGHRNISLYEVISFLFLEMKNDDITIRASSVAFSFFVSLFPTLLLFFTVIPFLPIPTFQTTLLDAVQKLIPDNAYALLQSTIEDIVTNDSVGLLSLSLILAFYYSSRGVLGLMNSFDKAFPIFRKRNFWYKQLVAFEIMALLLLLLIISVGLIIGGEFLVKLAIRLLNLERADIFVWFNIIRWLMILFVFYFSISSIYFFGPATHKRWQFFSAGSTLATILSILISLLFSWMINKFGQYNQLYGSIGTLLVAQLWIYYNSLSLLIGFELNAAIEINRHLFEGKNSKVKVDEK